MFEQMTYEKILSDMLSKVDSNLDKRPSSVIYDALAPAALQLAQAYTSLDMILDASFIDTSTDDYLERKGNEFSVNRTPAIASQRAVTFTGATVTIGKRFACSGVNWIVVEANLLECETPGILGNNIPIGTSLMSLETIAGLQSAVLGSVIRLGSETEDLEAYRTRIIAKINEPEINTNIAEVTKWCKSVAGVGAVRVLPLFDGVNTVKAILLDTQMKPVTSEIVSRVVEYIDPPDALGHKGLGLGQASIGCVFTAASADPLLIHVKVHLDYSSEITSGEIIAEVTSLLQAYLSSIAFKNDSVIYNKVGSIILSSALVIDYSTLTLNDLTGNIAIANTQVAILSEVTLI